MRFEQNADRVLFGPVKPRAETEADPVSRYLGAREARRASHEVDRLLYVAATRARKRRTWSAMCRWTTPARPGPAGRQPAWPPQAG